jgi:hypothetical protein
MEPFTTASGPKRGFVRAKEFNSGKMAASTKVTGKTTKLMDTAD